MRKFINKVIDEANNGNFSFFILVVGVAQLFVMMRSF